MTWVQGRIALTGDAAHPPLQYLAQGAVMAIEDAWVLSEHVGAQLAGRDSAEPGERVDWDAALAAYEAVRPEHCRRVVTTARAWGDLWHHGGDKRDWRNNVLRAHDVHDYAYVDWLYGPTALTPDQEPPMYPTEAPSPTAVQLRGTTGATSAADPRMRAGTTAGS
jgi:3-hydroxybenzoate 6-monooxygenase